MSDLNPLDEQERREPEREAAPRESRVGVYDTGAGSEEGERLPNPVNTYDRTDTGTGGFNLLGLLLTVIVIILVVFLLIQFVF